MVDIGRPAPTGRPMQIVSYRFILLAFNLAKFAGPLAQDVLDPQHEVKKCWLLSKEVIPPLPPMVDLSGMKVPGQNMSNLHFRNNKNNIKPKLYEELG